MSMIARFVQVKPERLAELLANPSSVAELFKPINFFFSVLDHQGLQQLAKQRLENATAISGDAPQSLTVFLETMDPASRQMTEQSLGVNIDDLKGPHGREIVLKYLEKSLHPLMNETPGARQENQGMLLSLEKTWHGVHYLLCGEVVLLRDGADDGRAFLGFADEENPFQPTEFGQVFARDLILALIPGKGENVQALPLGELFDGFDKGARHPRQDLGGGEEFAAMLTEEPGDAVLLLQARLNDIQIQAVKAFDGQGDMMLDDIGDASG